MRTEEQRLLRAPVLNYHRVHDLDDSFFRVRPATLRLQLEFLLQTGYRPISLSQFLDAHLRERPLPRQAVLITFDDGYEDFLFNAWPILEGLGISSTLFLIEGFIGRWNDWERDGGVRRRHLSRSQIEELLAAGVEIGSHSRTHPNLTQLDEAALLGEIGSSKERLEELFQVKIRAFAYPGGHHCLQVRRMTAEYYELGFAASAPSCSAQGDPYSLPRFDPSFCKNLEQFERMLLELS